MSRPSVGTVGSVPILIWPFSSLFYLPKSTISPKSTASSSLWGLNLLHQDNDTFASLAVSGSFLDSHLHHISLLRGPPCSQPQSLPGVQSPWQPSKQILSWALLVGTYFCPEFSPHLLTCSPLRFQGSLSLPLRAFPSMLKLLPSQFPPRAAGPLLFSWSL